MSARTATPSYVDASAISLSALCVIHCLALPVMAAFLPVLGVIGDIEWVHKALVVLALPITGYALFQVSREDTSMAFALLAIPGLSFLLAGAFVESLHDHETLLTVAGASMLAAAHIWRWRQLNA
ncbi:MAG: MerC domain-containing protein [Pseudomonadota bacterium]